MDVRLPCGAERRDREGIRIARQDRTALPAAGSQRQARHRSPRRLLAAGRPEAGRTQVQPHLLGRLHVPQCRDDAAKDLERCSRRHGGGPRRTWMGRTMRDLNVGLVGYGFMGRTHSNAFLRAPRFFDLPRRPVLKAVAARNEERVKKFAANWGYESYTTDWRELVSRKDIDVIDIASPNDTHHDIAIAAAKAGKIVMCEKPLGRNAKEAEAMVAAVESAGVPNTAWYNYRPVPAVTRIKQLIDEGTLGRVFH